MIALRRAMLQQKQLNRAFLLIAMTITGSISVSFILKVPFKPVAYLQWGMFPINFWWCSQGRAWYGPGPEIYFSVKDRDTFM